MELHISRRNGEHSGSARVACQETSPTVRPRRHTEPSSRDCGDHIGTPRDAVDRNLSPNFQSMDPLELSAQASRSPDIQRQTMSSFPRSSPVIHDSVPTSGESFANQPQIRVGAEMTAREHEVMETADTAKGIASALPTGVFDLHTLPLRHLAEPRGAGRL